MDKELAIVVPNEAAAYEVVKSLKGLDDEGSIELYSSTVVVKTASGALTVRTGTICAGVGPRCWASPPAR